MRNKTYWQAHQKLLPISSHIAAAQVVKDSQSPIHTTLNSDKPYKVQSKKTVKACQ